MEGYHAEEYYQRHDGICFMGNPPDLLEGTERSVAALHPGFAHFLVLYLLCDFCHHHQKMARNKNHPIRQEKIYLLHSQWDYGVA